MSTRETHSASRVRQSRLQVAVGVGHALKTNEPIGIEPALAVVVTVAAWSAKDIAGWFWDAVHAVQGFWRDAHEALERQLR